ncbi:LytTR family transcriptional regulator DNA-binding domain-containing protein [Paraclostridium bifermentans]|nr:LytTR family transcriptional regulator DNA-binding domain-containing protein [Paraclostridium bifermentans]
MRISDDLDCRIPPNFFKTHKSYIVNLKLIHKVIPTSKSALEIKFINFQERQLLVKL